LATREDVRRLEKMLAALQLTIDELRRDQAVQFMRIAQLQADIDVVRGAWSKVPPASDATSAQPPRKYTGPDRRLIARKK
jgi:hypothetical protein